MVRPRVQFWFSIGSTYTYLTVMRLSQVEKRHGVSFDWQPFSVRAVMQEMNNIPFVGKPAKEKYMWRDLERRADRYDLPIKMPVSYPLEHFDLANRIALVARSEGWCADYVRNAYTLWMQYGVPAGDKKNVAKSLTDAGQEVARVIKLAESAEVQTAYEDATTKAISLGVFGSPSFIVGESELFWGDDRLEDAIDFALQS